MTSFFSVTTLLIAVAVACLVAYMINYDFGSLEVALYIIGASIVLAGFGSIPLNHFLFGEPLYTEKMFIFHVGFFSSGLGAIFKIFNRLADVWAQKNDEKWVQKEVTSALGENVLSDGWKGNWD